MGARYFITYADSGRYWHENGGYGDRPKYWASRDDAIRAFEKFVEARARSNKSHPRLRLYAENMTAFAPEDLNWCNHPQAVLTGALRRHTRLHPEVSLAFSRPYFCPKSKIEAIARVRSSPSDVLQVCQNRMAYDCMEDGLIVGFTNMTDILYVRSMFRVEYVIDLAEFWVEVEEQYPGIRVAMHKDEPI